MSFGNDGWSLDFDRLAAAITPRTRALFVVSPSNPTGWTATHDDLAALLALARRHGLWIVADETYARFWYGEGARAPSFYRRDGAGRPHPVRQYVLQELGDDRLAHRLDRGESRARPGDREHDPVLDLGRRAVHAARRRRGASSAAKASSRTRSSARGAAATSAARRSAATGRCRFVGAAGRVLSVLLGRRRNRHAAARDAPDRRGECRASAGHRVRRRRRAVSCACALRATRSSLRPRSSAIAAVLSQSTRNGGFLITILWRVRVGIAIVRRAKHVDSVRKRAIRRNAETPARRWLMAA